MFVLQAV